MRYPNDWRAKAARMNEPEDPSVRMRRELWQKGGLCIPCTIEHGAFSSERLFRFNTPDGEHVGLCDICHILNAQAQPIALDWPPKPAAALGFVHCRMIRRNENMALVEVPPGDCITVPLDYLTEFGPGIERDWVSFGAANLREWKFEVGKSE